MSAARRAVRSRRASAATGCSTALLRSGTAHRSTWVEAPLSAVDYVRDWACQLIAVEERRTLGFCYVDGRFMYSVAVPGRVGVRRPPADLKLEAQGPSGRRLLLRAGPGT